MGSRNWTVYGYGINVDKINTTPEKVCKFIKNNVCLSEEETIKNIISEYDEMKKMHPDKDISNDFWEMFNDYADSDYNWAKGLTALIIRYLNEKYERIYFQWVGDDYNSGSPFILFEASLPWQLSEDEKTLTTEKLDEIYKECLSHLEEKPQTPDYYEIEQYG